MYFGSDNWAGAAPQIIAALGDANEGFAPAYGDDPLTQRVQARIAEVFETECAVFFVTTGGAANSLALSVLSPPYGAILCHDGSHVVTDECAGPEFYTGGAKLFGVAGADGKLTPAGLQQAVDTFPNHPPHSPPFAALSITQGTECGTLYTPDEVRALADFAHG